MKKVYSAQSAQNVISEDMDAHFFVVAILISS